MADGSVITFRPTTKSDNYPGVDINISKSTSSGDLKQQKIHFGKEDGKWWSSMILDLIQS